MGKLIQYQRDENISENDLLIGTDSVTKRSKNFVLGNLKTFFNDSYSLSFSFEYYSKNLNQFPYTMNYIDNKLSSIIYTVPNGFITKTFVYLSNKLDKITLSGNLDDSITKNKQFNYTLDKLTSVNYY